MRTLITCPRHVSAAVLFFLIGLVGITAAQANSLLDRAYEIANSEHPYIKSVIVIRDDEMIAERYFHGADANSSQNMKSLTKGVMSALVGVAIKEGFIESVDQRVTSILPEYLQTRICQTTITATF